MNALTTLLQADWTERMGWTLLHSLWQIALVAAAYAIVSRLLPNRSANSRYVIGCAALIVMLAFPMGTYVLLSHDLKQVSTDANHTPAVAELAAGLPRPIELPDSAASEMVAAPNAMVPADSVATDLSAALRPWLPWATIAWLMGVLLLSLRPLWGWLHVRGLQRNGLSPLPDKLRRAGESLVHRFGVKQAVRFAQSVLVEVPTVVGYLRPMVLLPASAIAGLSTAEIELILAHELAHVRRHDWLVNLAQTVLEALLFYHPGMWWISHQIRKERENCCDDMAVAIGGNRAVYVQALAHLEEQRSLTPATLLTATGGSLLARVHRLLGKPTNECGYGHATAWLAGLVTIAFVATALAMNQAPPEDTNEPPTENETPAEDTAKAKAFNVSNAEFYRAVEDLKKRGGLVRVAFKRTDPRHWVQIILEGDQFDNDSMTFVRLLSLDARTFLHLRNTAVTKEGLSKLRATKTAKLVLTGESTNDDSLSEMPNLPFLEELNLVETKATDTGFTFIGNCQRLKILGLSHNSQIGDKALAELKQLPELHRLSLGDSFSDTAVRYVNQLAKIDGLALTSHNMSNDSLRDVKSLPKLRYLRLGGDYVDDETLEIVGLRANELEDLYLAGCRKISDAGLKRIANLQTLQVLSLDGTSITDEGMENLKLLTRLRWLDLSDTSVTDRSLAIVGGMPRIRFLSLMNTNVTESGLEHLVGLENLRFLQLQGTFVKAIPEWMKSRKGLRVTLDTISDDTGLTNGNSKSNSLAKAVESFNKKAAKNPVGKFQSALTVGEVVAAIRGWDRKRHPVDDKTYEVYRSIAETGTMPKTAKLEYTTGRGPNNGYDFTVWWVNLDVMTSETTGYTFRIRKRSIVAHPTSTDVRGHLESDENKTRRITIRVLDPDGKPLKGIKVFRNHVYEREGAERPQIENKDYWTDAQGKALVALSGKSVDLRIWARKANFIPLHAMWAKQFQSDGDQIPAEFTFQLQPGTVIGGIVENEEGEPIEGVKVEVRDQTVDGSTRQPVVPGIRPVRDHYLAGGKEAVFTNAQGRWVLGNVPPERSLVFRRDLLPLMKRPKPPRIALRLTHPDYTGDHEWDSLHKKGSLQVQQRVTHESLRDQTATIVMKRRHSDQTDR